MGKPVGVQEGGQCHVVFAKVLALVSIVSGMMGASMRRSEKSGS